MQRVAEGIESGCDAITLLSLWERGVSQADVARADSLLAALDAVSAPLTLGERTVRLLRVHARLFGPRADLLSHCPACGADAQFAVDCAELAAQMPPHRLDGPQSLTVDDIEITFRLPTGADVAAASIHPDEDAFVRDLLERCVLSCTQRGQSVALDACPDTIVDALSNRIETLDPAANVSFALQCPACTAEWRAPLDCGRLVWQKVQAAAERLLLDIDALARAYGWTEPEVLALSPVRRAAYVQMIAP